MKRLAWLLPLFFAGCFNPTEPACSFRCSPHLKCPEDYLCRGDGICHLIGSTAACTFAVPDGGGDASGGADLLQRLDGGVDDGSRVDLLTDGAMPDGSSSDDLSMPDLAMPSDLTVGDEAAPADLLSPPDLVGLE